MKIAVAVAHTYRGAGCGANGYVNESDESRKIVPLVVQDLNSMGYIAKEFRIDKENSYLYEDCYVRAKMANEWGADLYIEIHLNSNPNPLANGTEVYIHPKDTDAIPYAKSINKYLCEELGTFDRTYGKGYKTEEYIVLSNTKMSAILLEPLFCSNEDDSKKYSAKKVADATIKGICGKLPIKEENMDKVIGYTAIYKDNNGAEGIGSLNTGATVDVITYWSTLSKIKHGDSFAYVDTSALESKAKKLILDTWLEMYSDSGLTNRVGTLDAGDTVYLIEEYSNAYKIYYRNEWYYLKKKVDSKVETGKTKEELERENKELRDKINKIKEIV